MDLAEFKSKLHVASNERFNAKVLLCNSYDHVADIQDAFFSENYEIKDLREYQSNENMWFGVSRLNGIINKIQCNTVLFSVSEIIRFYNKDDFRIFFDNLFSIEKKQYRIYIPLFGIKSRFINDYFNHFYRKNEFSFVYEIDMELQNIDLNIVDFNVPFENKLDTIKDWLNFHNTPQNNIICSPRPLVERINNHNSDDLIRINYISNQKEFLQKYMKKDFQHEFNNAEKKYWDFLIADLKDFNLNEILQTKLNLNELRPADIIKNICLTKNLYLNWILKGYCEEYVDKNSYFYLVVENSSLDEELIDRVWFDIFSTELNYEHANERFEILSHYYLDIAPSKKIEGLLKGYLSKYEVVVPFLTGITTVEKQYIIELYANNKIDEKYLETYYKDLLFYIDNVQYENYIPWVDSYFTEYKKSKIANRISKTLENMLLEKNESRESFFKWYSDTSFVDVNDFMQNKKNKLWIDGLGIEWLGLIYNYTLNKGFTCKVYLSKAKLPTTTECNKFFEINKNIKLDKYIHDQTSYKYPLDLIEEINIIKNILDDYFLEDDTVIVSDHGFSAFCSFKKKVNSYENVEHEGRCAKTQHDINDVDGFSYDFECGKYLVALNHNSLNDKTRREAHGGVTPEEVIVPIIYLQKDLKMTTKTTEIEVVNKGYTEEDYF